MGFSVQAAMNLLPGLEWAPDCTQASSAKGSRGLAVCGSGEGVSMHMDRRPFEVQDGGRDEERGGVRCRSGARGQLPPATHTTE